MYVGIYFTSLKRQYTRPSHPGNVIFRETKSQPESYNIREDTPVNFFHFIFPGS